MDNITVDMNKVFDCVQDTLECAHEELRKLGKSSALLNRTLAAGRDRITRNTQGLRRGMSQGINSSSLRRRTITFAEYITDGVNALIDIAKEKKEVSDVEEKTLREMVKTAGMAVRIVEPILDEYTKNSSSKPASSGTHAHSSGTKKTSGKSSSFPEGLDEETAQALKDLDFKGDRLPRSRTISLQYRKCYKEYHPDRNQGDSEERKMYCAQKIRKINAAYELLKGKGLTV